MSDIVRYVLAFVASREFLVNFFANLGGAMGGVLLAFWFERIRTNWDARILYGKLLRTSRFELAYLKTMCATSKVALLSDPNAGGLEPLGVPATRALLMSPLFHDLAPFSLIMAITTLCAFLNGAEKVFERTRNLNPQAAASREKLCKILSGQHGAAEKLMGIALEQIDLQLRSLRLERAPDVLAQQVGRRLTEAVVSAQLPLAPEVSSESSPKSDLVEQEGGSREN
jgi:hypothetical protein